MNLKLEIRRNADGAMTTQVWPDWSFSAFWWEEGNAACDCNREDFFLQAQGIDTDDRESGCGEGRYSVRCTDADTGEVLYDELGPNVRANRTVEAGGRNGSELSE